MLALDRQEPAVLLIAFGQDTDETLAFGQTVALLAGQLTGPAADAFVEIEDHGILGLGLGQRLG